MSISGKRVLITGASGFIAANLARKLIEENAEIYALDTATSWKTEALQITNIKTDITNLEAVKKAVTQAQPEIVFHLAAYGVNQSADVQTAINVNITGTANLLSALVGSKIEKIIHTGTCHEYGDKKGRITEETLTSPKSVYAATKAASTALCLSYYHQHALPINILRPFVAYGPFSNPYTIISTTILHALNKKDVPLSSCSANRDFVFIEDVADAYIKAATAKASGEIFNIGSGTEESIKEVVTKTLSLMGNPVKPLFGALPDRKGEIMHLQADNLKAKKLLEWQPKTSLEQGLKKTIEWFKQNNKFYAGEQK